MSRAFVKETDGDEASFGLPERPQSPHTNYVTPAGLEALRHRVTEMLRCRAGLGSPEDMAGKQQVAVLERDLRYYEQRLETAVPVYPGGQVDEKVHFGSTVEVLDEEGLKQSFTIVGEDEADVGKGKISWVSPLAKALLDAQIGEEVTWLRPAGNRRLEVTAIRYARHGV
jgi:transcription elongation factor GreB